MAYQMPKFSPRKVAKRDTGMTMQKAEIDTVGMDPEMKSTLMGMRGAMGSASPDRRRRHPLSGVMDVIGAIFGKK